MTSEEYMLRDSAKKMLAAREREFNKLAIEINCLKELISKLSENVDAVFSEVI